ncbi:hypothetical protein [Paraburkholderia tropica]|uniref:hypothetical protein n=1 Tax=Paraburkholderia tropica TaxID=92647 RepID=UPI002AAFFCC4|nr:hypothetical protein [Paraburkholderia tropica]
MIRIRPAPLLATTATGSAICMSALAGWQRGGTVSERIVWVAIGVVLVVSAHLLPALIRSAPVTVRLMGIVLWGACMITACYGHGYFFAFAQRHAGEARASAIVNRVTAPARPLAPVMEERASVARELALAKAQRCSRNCRWLEVRRVALTTKLDALESDAEDIRRQDAESDRAASQRDTLLADPVTARLAALLGIGTARVDLLSGLGYAAVLEGVACLLWSLALRPPSLVLAPVIHASTLAPLPAETAKVQPTVTPVTQSRGATPRSHAAPDVPLTPSADTVRADDDVIRLAQAIAAGHVRPTVASIRSYLGCSQARASALRKLVIQSL